MNPVNVVSHARALVLGVLTVWTLVQDAEINNFNVGENANF